MHGDLACANEPGEVQAQIDIAMTWLPFSTLGEKVCLLVRFFSHKSREMTAK